MTLSHYAFFTPRLDRQRFRALQEYEKALHVARALGIEAEAVALHEQGCERARQTYERPPTLRECVHQIIAKANREAG